MRTLFKLGIGLMLCMGISSCTEVSAKHYHDGVESEAKCTGSAYCRACKTCNYCKHCNSGGKCGVCK